MATTTITKIILRRGTSTEAADVLLSIAEPAWVTRPDGHHDLYIGDGINKPGSRIASSEAFYGAERSTDPTQPAEGEFVVWMSKGLAGQKGDAGDILVASTAGGITKYMTILDHNLAATSW